MKKPWSISTTVRNPERIRDFLKVLLFMDGEKWTRPNQKKFQILLIQNKVYGYGEPQFYNNLSEKHLALMNTPDPITYEEAKEILDAKNYVGGGDMRGRQSFNPLEKMGLALVENNKIKISSFGKYFLQEDYDLGNVFFRSFLKWQLPNPLSRDFKTSDGYAIKPFIGFLHLIKEVNLLWQKEGNKPVGISKQEFAIFVPTLINFKSIKEISKEIIKFRKDKNSSKNKEAFTKNYHKQYVINFLNSHNRQLVSKTIANTIEYADNTIRYFRLTRYINIRGNGFYIDLESRRMIEIGNILAIDDGSPKSFLNTEKYAQYLADVNQPVLPWETEVEFKNIISVIKNDIENFVNYLGSKSIDVPKFKFKEVLSFSKKELEKYAEDLRSYRRTLQDVEVRSDSQNVSNIKEYIEKLKNIYQSNNKRSIELEKLAALAINALNDAIQIKPNYPVGDDNEPTFTAPPNKSDIECFYQSFNSVCEVTMLKDRSQWYNEGQPVMRHVRDFEEDYPEKSVYCLFVAPKLHQDTIETFWMAIKHGYRGKIQRIIPLSIQQLINVLEILVDIKESGKELKHENLSELYKNIISITNNVQDSNQWIAMIPNAIESWGKKLTIQ